MIYGMSIGEFASLAFGGLLVLFVLISLFVAQFRDESKFDISRIFQNDKDETSGSLLWAHIMSGAAVWIVVNQEIGHRLSTELLLGVLAILVAGKLGQTALDRGALGARKQQTKEPERAPDPRAKGGGI